MLPPLGGVRFVLYWLDREKRIREKYIQWFFGQRKKARMIAVMLIMTACFIIGILSIHSSPTTLESNWAVSNEDG